MEDGKIERKMKKFLDNAVKLSESVDLSTREIVEISAKKAGFVIVKPP